MYGNVQQQDKTHSGFLSDNGSPWPELPWRR